MPLAAMHGLRAYSWCAVYFVSICLSDTCGKHLISGLQWRSMWGPVLYTNLLATPVMCMFGLVGGEGPRLLEAEWRQRAVLLYGLSCVFGIAISFTGNPTPTPTPKPTPTPNPSPTPPNPSPTPPNP